MNPTSSRRSLSYGVVKGSTAESISVEAKLDPSGTRGLKPPLYV
jgi:hypothetical protein